jgi:hypothetical protein
LLHFLHDIVVRSLVALLAGMGWLMPFIQKVQGKSRQKNP